MVTDQEQKIFLLGGMDLEMSSIRTVLSSHEIPFIDHQLSWNNAYLSSYRSELETYSSQSGFHIYGVELIEDIIPPLHYTRIDHHNDYFDRPSSLLQVLDLLHLPVERYHQLVAANDENYIPGLQTLGATSKEIEEIRLQDRQCQGVTSSDENLAQQAIKNSLQVYPHLTIVHSQTSRFSAIADRLYPYGNLLIYTDSEAIYFGENVSILKTMYVEEIHRHAMFYGGHDGFFGIARGYFTTDEIRQYIDTIIQLHSK